ncbi:MAG: HEAT repeat domain-containing protein [bacterium]|nr:HEAT repeat domain-containing protein [bacterium]
MLSYLYGGLTSAEVEAFRQELASNAELAQCLAAEETGLHAHLPVGNGLTDLPDSLVDESRLLLRAALRRQVREPLSMLSQWSLWLGAIAPRLIWTGGSVALVLCGVLLGRVMPGPSGPRAPALTAETLVDVEVRGYDAAAGRIELELVGLATTHVEGDLADPQIQALLSAALLGDLEAGSRLLAVDLLRHQTASSTTRQALTEALLSDENPGVRIAAAAALSGLGADDGVRRALQQVLVEDDNAGVRVAAIEGLRNISHDDTRDVMERVSRFEPNPYIRAEARHALDVGRAIPTHL